MILIDGTQLMIAGILADNSNMMLNEELIRHTTLNSIRSWRKKYKKTYGEIVLAFDSKESWRKKYYPQYKAIRKKKRESSPLDWNEVYRLVNVMKKELIEYFPYKIIEVYECEGDDVIATLARWSIKNGSDETGMFSEPKPVLIISTDGDFHQLHNAYIKQISMKTKKFVELEHTTDFVLHDHICRGDKDDGVPNVLSDDLCLVEERRQKSIYDVKVREWFEDLPSDETFLKNYERNKLMVDLSCIPKEYQDNIINTYSEYKVNNRSKLLNYFVSNKLKLLMDNIQDF